MGSVPNRGDKLITIALLCATVCMALNAWTSESGLRKVFAQRESLARSQQTLRDVNDQADRLRSQVALLSTSSRAREKAIREATAMARENEVVVFFGD
jgi:cell division protein FtsB